MTFDGTPASRAQEFIVFCDALDDAGCLPEYARRGRVVARDLVAVLDALEAERSARVALQQARDRAVARLGQRAHDALIESDSRTHTRHPDKTR